MTTVSATNGGNIELIWKHYEPSIVALQHWLSIPGVLENHDKKEYFMRYK